MSFAIVRMQKFKASDVKGMQIHNYREKESRTNPDIDEDRTQLNYDLLNDSRIDFNQAIQNEIDERYEGTKAIRKDAVKLCEFVVTSNKDFFDRLDSAEEKRFFKETLSFLQDRYGKENILYGIVHKDEKTPHMHVGMVPITEDGKLAAKQFFGQRTELQQLQDTFHEHVTKKGFDLERGVSSDRKHITTQRLKAMTVREEIQTLEQEKKEIDSRLNDLKMSLDKAKGVDKIEIKERGGFIRPKTVEIASEDFESIKVLAKASETLKSENRRLKQENENLSERKQFLDTEVRNLNGKNQKLEKENDFLRKTLDRVKDLYKQKLPDLANTIGYIKASILDKAKEKLLTKYFGDDDETRGAQEFLAHKREQLEKEKQERKSKSRSRSRSISREIER